MSGWAERYGPVIGLFHLGLLLMALDFGSEVLSGGSPITPEIYGPAVYAIPALAWVGMQLGGSALCVIGSLVRGRLRGALFLIGGGMSGLLFAAFAVMASDASQGSVLEAGSRWFVTPLCFFTSFAGWGVLYVRR